MTETASFHGSRTQFVWPTFLQTTAAVCEGLDAAWRFFGAMARVLIPDNMSALIAAADPLAPTIVAAFLDYAQARGLFVDPARVRAPRDKGRVENQVAYVHESWFDGEVFTALIDARASAEHWCRDVSGPRARRAELLSTWRAPKASPSSWRCSVRGGRARMRVRRYGIDETISRDGEGGDRASGPRAAAHGRGRSR